MPMCGQSVWRACLDYVVNLISDLGKSSSLQCLEELFISVTFPNGSSYIEGQYHGVIPKKCGCLLHVCFTCNPYY